MKELILICIYLAIDLTFQLKNIKDFRTNPLGIALNEGVFQVNTGLPDNSRVMAYIDLDSDKKVDAIIIEKSEKSKDELISFYNYNYESGVFIKSGIESLKIDNIKASDKIYEIIPTSLNNDDHVDLIISTIDISNPNLLNVYVYLGSSSTKFIFRSSFATNSGIMVLNIDGSNYSSLLYFDIDKNRRVVSKYDENIEQKTIDFSTFIDPSCELFSNDYAKKHIGMMQSTAFLDIDGDCTPDIILTSPKETSAGDLTDKTIEIWRGKIVNGQRKYCLNENSIIPLVTELSNFNIVDINRDGMLDLVFPINNKNPRILIAYNQIPLKMSWDDDYCIKHPNSDNKFELLFDITKLTNPTSDAEEIALYKEHKNQIINVYSSADEIFYSESAIPSLIRIGDIDSDSYPDITFVLKNTETNERQAHVLLNCMPNEINTPAVNLGLRTFLSKCGGNQIKIDFEDSYALKNNTVYSSFFDLDDNGQLDLLMVTSDSNNNYYVTGFYNNYNYDTFFLKSIDTKQKSKFFGITQGTTYRYIVTNLDGSRRMDISYQSAQMNALALQMPFAFIGVGRSNNYIENFQTITVSYSLSDNNYKQFTPIIPNSQLLISENLNDQGVFMWELELIVNPMSILLTLIVAISGILFLLLGTICYLHRKEVKEDQENDNLPFTQWFN